MKVLIKMKLSFGLISTYFNEGNYHVTIVGCGAISTNKKPKAHVKKKKKKQ